MNPCILHQTWKTKGPSKFDKYVYSWTNCKLLQRKFYDDNDIVNYIKNNFPDFLNFFLSMKNNIERVDFFRYAVMFKEGGIYADMDTILINPKKLFYLMNLDIVLGFEIEKGSGKGNVRTLISQCILMSKPNNSFWFDLMVFIQENYNENKYPTYNTGPDVVSSFIKINKKKYKLNFTNELVNGGIIKHAVTGVWRTKDMFLLKKNCLICKQTPNLCFCYNGLWFLNK